MNAALPYDFDAALLGLCLPAVAAQALQEASASCGDAQAELGALMRAQSAAPEHPAVLIALYRHHFYGHRLQPARAVARRALVVGARALGLPEVWHEVPRSPLPGARHDPTTRFYLFALKGLAYLSLRLGDGAEAREALALLRALDPHDWIGAALLEDVRLRALRRAALGADADDADDEEPAERDVPAGLRDGRAGDPDWRLRGEEAGRARGATLQRLLFDVEPGVRERAAELTRQGAREGVLRPQPEEPGHG